jgi:hypothetical protein
MTWEEVKLKYTMEAKRKLHKGATEEDIAMYVYNRIVEKTCCTNAVFDEAQKSGLRKSKWSWPMVLTLLKGIFALEKINVGTTERSKKAWQCVAEAVFTPILQILKTILSSLFPSEKSSTQDYAHCLSLWALLPKNIQPLKLML